MRCTTQAQAEKGTAEMIAQSQSTQCSDYPFTVYTAHTLSAHCVELMPTYKMDVCAEHSHRSLQHSSRKWSCWLPLSQ